MLYVMLSDHLTVHHHVEVFALRKEGNLMIENSESHLRA